MSKKNKSDPENLNDDEGTGLDGLLSDFANILGDDDESSENQEIDHDGMALSEILGEDVSQNAREKQQFEPEIVDEDEDYASFLMDFGELESKETSETEPVGDSGDSEVYAVFTSDLHLGNKMFCNEEIKRFVDWINGERGTKEQKETAKKVK